MANIYNTVFLKSLQTISLNNKKIFSLFIILSINYNICTRLITKSASVIKKKRYNMGLLDQGLSVDKKKQNDDMDNAQIKLFNLNKKKKSLESESKKKRYYITIFLCLGSVVIISTYDIFINLKKYFRFRKEIKKTLQYVQDNYQNTEKLKDVDLDIVKIFEALPISWVLRSSAHAELHKQHQGSKYKFQPREPVKAIYAYKAEDYSNNDLLKCFEKINDSLKLKVF